MQTTQAHPQATPAPLPNQPWPEQSGTYAGISAANDTQAAGHIVLLDARPAGPLNWADAVNWAESLGDGARLPTRSEAALLFANAKDKLQPRWHWLNEEYDASYAWHCYFGSGHQYDFRKSYEGCAVAVRRLSLQSFNPLDSVAA